VTETTKTMRVPAKRKLTLQFRDNSDFNGEKMVFTLGDGTTGYTDGVQYRFMDEAGTWHFFPYKDILWAKSEVTKWKTVTRAHMENRVLETV
jgi:hypothetical protein